MAISKVKKREEKDLRVAEIARRWNTTTAYIYKLLGTHKLVGHRDVDGNWLISMPQIEAYEARTKARRRHQHPAETAPTVALAALEARSLPTLGAETAEKPAGNGHAQPRRRAEDIFPSFRLVLGDPGDFMRRLDDLFGEMRSLRRQMEAITGETSHGKQQPRKEASAS